MRYQIAVTVTVVADSEDEAKYTIGEFFSAATLGEMNPIEDYSIEETMEVYEQ